MSVKSFGVDPQVIRNNGWQPIETAPQDGTNILGWSGPMGGIEIVWWAEDGSGWDRGDYEPGGRPKPIMWQPLPPPPQ